MIDQHRTRGTRSTVAFFLVILIIIALITQWLDISIMDPEDLRPYRKTGITKEMVEKAKDVAHVRIVVVNGRLYTEKYKKVFQTRDIMTEWGILQLLRLYHGKLSDLDLMLECDDIPVIRRRDYGSQNASIPPLFHYRGDGFSYDTVLPDLSFREPEVNIKPWEELKEDIKEGNKRIKWKNRETTERDKVKESAFDKALAEHEDIDDFVGSAEPTVRDHGVDLQQPVLIKIDSSDSHQK
ncbi:hypothetical protein OROMI_009254 [Orobanche minor]